jgi:hypothetical protein
MTNERRTATLASRNSPKSGYQQSEPELNSFSRSVPAPHIYRDNEENQYMHIDPHSQPTNSIEPLNSAYLDSLGVVGDQTMQQGPGMDWLWDMVMNDDANMFDF